MRPGDPGSPAAHRGSQARDPDLELPPHEVGRWPKAGGVMAFFDGARSTPPPAARAPPHAKRGEARKTLVPRAALHREGLPALELGFLQHGGIDAGAPPFS